MALPATLIGTRSSALVWGGAGLLALALHAGAFAAAFLQAPREEGTELGASAIEVGIELASPQTEKTDLPPGPESDAAAASTASVQQRVAEPQKTEDEPEKPTEAENPDRVVAPERVDKPVEQAVAAPQQTEASTESAAAEATAPPPTETRKDTTRSTAPTLGMGESATREKLTWQRLLVAHLDRNKRYPAMVLPRGAEILVSFTLDRTGRVMTASLLRGSGDPAYDEAALDMVRRSSPVPAPPPLVADEGLTFTVPVVFRPRGRG